MNFTLLTVGKTDVPWVKDGLDLYMSRLKHYAPFTLQEIPELKKASALTREQIKEKEGALILSALRQGTRLILLDERGKEMRSLEFSAYIEKLLSGGRDVTFAVGGAYGFSEEVYERADSMISLSKMTFSHQMIRLMAIEQIYRAMTILRGEPYHHE